MRATVQGVHGVSIPPRIDGALESEGYESRLDSVDSGVMLGFGAGGRSPGARCFGRTGAEPKWTLPRITARAGRVAIQSPNVLRHPGLSRQSHVHVEVVLVWFIELVQVGVNQSAEVRLHSGEQDFFNIA